MTGGLGDDYYQFVDGWDHDTVVEAADGGSDTVTFYAYTGDSVFSSATPVLNDLAFWLDNSYLVNQVLDLEDGTNIVDFTFTQVEYIYGGAGIDELHTLDANSTFDLDGRTYDTDPAFKLEVAIAQLAATETNTYTCSAAPTVLEFMNIEKLFSGSANDTFNILEDQVFELHGGAGNDIFVFNNGVHLGDLTGSVHPGFESTIDGQGGIDTLDYSAFNTAIDIDLTTGRSSYIGANEIGRLATLENLIGGSGNDILTGDAGNNVITGNTGNDTMSGGLGNDTFVFANGWGTNDVVIEAAGEGDDTLDFSAVTVALTTTLSATGLQVTDNGSPANLVTYSGNALENLTSGSGDDTFVMSDGAVIPGRVDGGAGINTLDYSAYMTGRDVLLTALGTLTGFAGTELALVNGFDNISIIIGSKSNADRITGMDAVASFTIDSIDHITYTVGSNTLDFSDFEYVSGGGDVDTFNFSATYSDVLEYLGGAGNDIFALIGSILIPGKINGQGGTDTLTYAAFTTGGVVVNLAANIASAIFDALAGGISNIENIIGSAFDDTLIGDAWNNLLDGADGNDNITGAEGNDTLAGGSGSDIFHFLDNWGSDVLSDLAGALDEVDFSAVTGSLLFAIAAGSLDVTGSGLLAVSGNVIEKLVGGKREDEFVFENGANITGGTGTIDGREGQDRLNYSAYSVGISVDLALGTATGTGGITSISDVYGGSGNDAIYGDDLANVLRGGLGDDILNGRGGVDTLDESNATVSLTINLNTTIAQATGLGNDTITNMENVLTGSGSDTLTGDGNNNYLYGGTGDDSYVFLNAYGTDTVSDPAGDDTFNFSTVTTSLDFAFNAITTIITTIGGSVSTGTEIENYLGGTVADTFHVNASRTADLTGNGGADTFYFADGVVLTGFINGSVGADTIDWSSYNSTRSIQLTGSGADGFTGTEASITAGYSNIDNLIGGIASDTLTGTADNAYWQFNTDYRYIHGTNQLVFSGFENLVGGAGVDAFAFQGTSTFTGTLNGAGGTDVLNFNGYDSGVTVNLESLTASTLVGTFSNIESMVGSIHNDSLSGDASGSTFAVTGVKAGTVDGWFNFTAVDTLVGSTATDILTYAGFIGPAIFDLTSTGALSGFDGTESNSGLTFQNVDQLVGTTASNDSLQGLTVASVWVISGADVDAGSYNASSRQLTFSSIETLIGESSADHLNLSGYGSAVAVLLNATTSTDGFNGTTTGLTGGFSNMNSISATSASTDRLTGANLDATWDVTAYTYTVGTHVLSFNSFDQWVGGSAADTFHFTNASAFTGTLDGAAGVDILDYSTVTIPVQTVLSATGSVDGFAGTTTGMSGTFDNIDVLISGTNTADTLSGAPVMATFELDGSDRYFYGSFDIEFSGYENLVGGSLADTFIFSGARAFVIDGSAGNDIFRFNNNSSLTGTITGNTGSDRIDLSAYALSRTVTLTGTSTDGFVGTVTGVIPGGFSNIDQIYGSSSATSDQLYGVDAIAQWNLNGTASQYSVGSNNVTFQNFEYLQGGQYADTFILNGAEAGRLFGNAGDDVFLMMNSASLNGTIIGGGGVNLLDYSLFTTTVDVNLTDGTATGITSVASIQSVYGGSANDTLLGNNGENTLKGNGGDDALAGGDGNDIYLFENGFGQDTLTELTGVDTFDFSAVTTTILFNLASFTLTNGSANSVNYHANLVERFIGGSADDTFFFADQFALPTGGWINGSEGSDWLDYNAYTTSVTVNLTSGAATGVPSGVANVENAIGGSAGDSLTGNASVNTLEGRDGNDTITGMTGNDILNGGNGNDTYVFSGDAWGVDTLLDAAGTDTLDYTTATTDLMFDISSGLLTVGDGTNTLTVSSGNVIERLLGGTGDDTFKFENGVGLAGGGSGTYIDGGTGNNTLDYTAYTTDVIVSLAGKFATGVNNGQAGGINNIQNVMGGTSINMIWGDENDNILESGTTNDYLYGLGGNDTYVFYNGWGTDHVFDTTGNDTLTFINTTTGVTFTFAVGSATVTDGLGNIVTTDGNVENFIGTNYADTFIFQAGASIGGYLDGQGAYDNVNLSAYTSVIHVTLSGLGAVDGFNGTIASIGSFANVDQMTASSLNGDSLTGRNAVAEFLLGTGDQYVSELHTFDFSAFEILNGGTAADTFRIQTNHTNTLNGGSGTDSFVFSNGVSLTGTLDGGGDSDTLDFSATSTRMVTLSGIGTIDGFSGNDVSVTGGFSNINTLVGSVYADTLTGTNLAATFELDGTDRYVFGSNSLAFSAFETLVGGNASDTFAFGGLYTFTGTLNGAGGSDWLDYNAYGSAISYNMNTGVITGLNGTFSSIEGLRGSASTADVINGSNSGSTFNMTADASGNINGIFVFSSIENLAGGTGTDSINYSGYGSAVTVNTQTSSSTGLVSYAGMEGFVGSTMSDTIIGRDSGSSFIINGTNSGSVDGTNFSSFENLTGAGGNDIFRMNGSGSLSGLLNGAAGLDTVNYAGYGSAITINLQTLTATGLPAGFVSIETVIGSANSDTIVGSNTGSNFQITAANTGLVSGFSFSSIENLTGGTGSDTFTFNPGGSFNGNLNGGAGTDLLDYSSYAASITVNLLAGTAGNVGGLVSNIENMNGSALNDILTGDNNANTINAVGGNDTISGNGGNDLFVFPAGSFFAGTLDGGAGSDTANFSAQTGVLTVVISALSGLTDGFNGTINGLTFTNLESLTASNQTGDSLAGMNATATWNIGASTYTSGGRSFTYASIESLIGGSGTDTFTFANGVTFDGTINGGSGSDTLNYAAYTTARNVVLNALGSLDGFGGTEASISGGFTNINVFTASTSGSDSLTGRDVVTTWAIDGSNVYVNGSNQLTFSSVEILVGGSAADTFNISGTRAYMLRGGAGDDIFNFSNNSILNGSVDGSTGSDTLSFASYTSARNVTLTAATTEGFTGTQVAITSGFSGIDHLAGSSATSDTLTGINTDAAFMIGSAHSYTAIGYTLGFSGYENLVGNTAADTFSFSGIGTLSSTINGAGGSDTIDYTNYNTAATVNLTSGMATGLGGGISGRLSNVENITGSAFGDTLTGDANNNVISGLAGNDTLTGAGGNDTYLFSNGFNADTIIEAVGGGVDTLDFSAVSNSLIFNINASSLTGGYGANTITSNGLTIETLIGSSVADRFVFAVDGSLNGTINGSTGTDTLDYNLYATGVAVNLSGGTASGTLGVSSIEDLIGSAFADSLTGDNGSNTITGGAGNDTLTGLGGNDLYLFADGYGMDSIVEADAGGDDTMDFTAVTQPVTMTVTDSTIHIVYGSTNDASHTGIFVEHFLGANGTTTLDLSTVTSGRHVVLTNLGSDRGFMGTVNSITSTLFTFNNVDTIIGTPALDDSLTGMNAISDWNLTGTSGGSYFSTRTLTYTDFENLIGGSLADTFKVTESVTFTGKINGSAGNDSLSYTGYTTATLTSLTGLSIAGGFTGTATGLSAGFENIDLLVGGDGLDTLNGLQSAGGTFSFGTTQTYTSGVNILTFSGMNQLNGGTEADIFNFQNGYGFTGSIDGKAGNDTLTYAGYTTSVTVTFTGVGAIDGFNGTSTNLSAGTFANIDTIIGTSEASVVDTLTGMNSDAIFRFDTIDTYNVIIGTITYTATFSGFDKLVGGTANDLFQFIDLNTYTGDIDGGNGTDLLDYHLYDTAVTVDLGGIHATALFGTFVNLEGMIGSPFNDTLIGRVAGSTFHVTGQDQGDVDNNFTFVSVETLQGGTNTDTLDYSKFGGPVAFVLTGESIDGFSGTAQYLTVGFSNMNALVGTVSSNDSLTGRDGIALWEITSTTGGTYEYNSTIISYTNIENLLGGNLADTFHVHQGITYIGSLDGRAGVDILTYSDYTSAYPVIVKLNNVGTMDGFDGTATGISNGFKNIDRVIGGAATDSLTGTDLDAVFDFDGTDQYQAGGHTLDFEEFDQLFGGSGRDIFRFSNGIGFIGRLSGGDNVDTLDYSAYTTQVVVNLSIHAAQNVTGGVYEIENIIGGSNNDTLTGDENSNVITGNAGNDTLTGNGGNDTFLFANGWGTDTVAGDAGEDALDFSAVTVSLIANLSGLHVTDGTNRVNFTGVDVIIGGTNDDTFNITGSQDYDLYGMGGSDQFRYFSSGALTGLINGGAGHDILDYQNDTSTLLTSRYFTLTGIGTSGFNGTETTITAGFLNIDEIIAGQGADTVEGINQDGTFNIHTTSVDYSAGGTDLHLINVENLVGGTGNDSFILDDTAVLPGSIDGKTGTDTLDYSAYTTAVTVNLVGGTATGITKGVASIERVIGTLESATTIYGDDNDNIFNIAGNGNYNIYGLGGNDTYVIDADTAVGQIYLFEDTTTGGFGVDTIDFSTTTGLDLVFSLNSTAEQVLKSGTESLSVTLDSIAFENLVGGTGNDTLTGTDGVNVITGGSGNDTVTGLGGSDRYIFSNNWGMDTVVDSAGNDTFDFSAATVNLTASFTTTSLQVSDGTNQVTSTVAEIENLIGGSGSDTFIFADTVQLNGVLNGSGGNDRIDLSAYTTGRSIVLTGLGSVDGYAGTESTIIPAGFDNINEIIGAHGSSSDTVNDTLTGLSENSHWTVETPTYTYTVDGSGRTLTFTYFNTLVGLSAEDVFTIQTGTQEVDIYGGSGDDTLVMSHGARLTGFFDGQGDYDTIDYHLSEESHHFHLDEVLGATDGFNVIESCISVAAYNIQNIIAGQKLDSLYGRDQEASWDVIAGVDTYTDTRTLNFVLIEDLYGRSQEDSFYMNGDHTGRMFGQGGNDFFYVMNDAVLYAYDNDTLSSGYMDGGAGYDELDYTDYNTPSAFDLTALGADDGFNGTVANLVGGFFNFNFILGRNGSGRDSLQGLNTDSLWNLVDADLKSEYTTQSRTLHFSYIDSLIGEGGADQFVFGNDVTLTGGINGGAGYDTLDYSAYTSVREITLTDRSTDGFAGTEASLGLGFSQINAVIGGSALDTLTTLNSDSSFLIDRINGGTYTNLTNTLEFTYFDNLVAGTGADIFNFSGTGTITTSINSGEGTDEINYSLYDSAVNVNLSTGAASGVHGGLAASISGFENITGSEFGDTLTGDNLANRINGLAGNDQLTGLDGNDTYIFQNGWGTDVVAETATGGTDTFDFSAATIDLLFTQSGNLTVTGVYSSVTSTVTSSNNYIENLTGGSANDIFNVTGTGVLTGRIDGQTGSNTLSFNGLTTAQTIILTSIGSSVGFAGTATSVLGGFDNITALVGSALIDSLTGLATGGIFNLTALNFGSYTSTARVITFTSVDILNGLGGYDTLDFTGHATGANISLTGANSSGFNGTDSSLSGSFNGMDRIIGSASVDTLTGMNQAATFEIDGSERYLTGTSPVFVLDLSGIENLTGGTNLDIFKISASHTGRLNGGAGSDTLDYSVSTTAINVHLTELGTIDGYNGEGAYLTGGFANMDVLVGHLTGDQLTGMDVAYTWNISPTTNQYEFGGHTFDFSHIEIIAGGSANDTFIISGNSNYTLYGGAGDDTFTFQNGATLTGILDGQAGNDTIDYHLYTSAVQVNLSSSAVIYNLITYQPQSAPGINGGLANGITSIESVTGSSANDILIGSDGDNTINGSAGNDILIGGLGNDTYLFGNTWGMDVVIEAASAGSDTISFAAATTGISFTRGVTATCATGTCAGDGTNLVTHSGGQIESFTGGSGNDTFTLTNGSTMSGRINGGAGTDVLNLSAYASALTYTLTGLGSVDGFAGTATPITGDFDNINTIQSGTRSDSFTGLNTDSTYTITASGIIYTTGGNSLSLTSVENLTGGSADDTFRMMNTASISGRINGGSGTDTLDYSGYTAAVSINLSTGTATGISGGIQSIENVIGSPIGNTITGDNNDNILIGTDGNDTILGLGGNDTLIGLGGNDTLNGGNGTDTIDYSANTTAGVVVNLTTNMVTSTDSGTDTLISIENVIGSNLVDTIIGNTGNNVIDGRGGNDILNGNGGDDTYIFTGAWGSDSLTDSAGTDTLNFSAISSNLVVQIDTGGMLVSSSSGSLTVTGAVIENIITGSGADTFQFANGASLTGTVNGLTGNNTLDLSAYNSGTNTFLTGLGTNVGFTGTVAGILSAGFDNITNLIGSTSAVDTLTGRNAASVWNVDNDGNSYQSGGRTLTFSQVENLTGNTADDTFRFDGSGSISGNINGGSGSNILDYSTYTLSGITTNLGSMTTTGIGGTFAGIASLVGSSQVDTLIGANTVNTFNLTGVNTGNVNGTFTYSGIENLTGGNLTDAFVFADQATQSGTINGSAGTDTLDYRAYTTNLNVDLAAGTAVAGGVTTTVNNIENVVSGQANDTITGNSGDNVLTDVGGTDTFDGGLGNDRYVFLANWGTGDVVTGAGGIDWMDFSNISTSLIFNLAASGIEVTSGSNFVTSTGYIVENLVGGSGADQFNITGAASVNLFGNGGNDSFNFVDTGTLTGNIAGGTGTNSLNYSGYDSAITYNLQNSTITGLTGSITDIQNFVGSANSDTIIGRNSGTSFNITAANAGNVDGQLVFSSVENLSGGTGNDTFTLVGSGSLSGVVDGVSGYDTLSYNGYGSAVSITLSNLEANGYDGQANGLSSFSRIDNLVGSTHVDSLTGLNTAATFEVDGTNRYSTGSSYLDFSAIENLNGGSLADSYFITGTQTNNLYGQDGADLFIFANNAILNGSLNGGAGADVLNLTNYTTGQTITLVDQGSVDGFTGIGSVLTGTFDNINTILGSNASGDTLTGVNETATFDLAAGTYTSANLLAFAGFETLNGGAASDSFLINDAVNHNLNGGLGNDTFFFSNTNQLTGSIDGGAGTDTMNYHDYTSPVIVNFATGHATAVSGSISNMENFTGSATASNTVYGDDNDNILVGGPSDDILVGGKGNDTYIFADNWGTDKVIEYPNEGNDTLDFSGVTGSGIVVVLDGTTLTVNDSATGTNEVTTETPNNVENVIGTNQADQFIIKDSTVVTGKLDGMGGNDVLDYSSYDSARHFILTSLGSGSSFNGTETSILGGFYNMDQITGTSYVDTLTGMNAAAIWNITGAATENYQSSGHTMTFSGIENLNGGTGSDAFTFADAASHSGDLTGGAGVDQLDYSAYSSSVTVNLLAGTATGVVGLVSQIENVTGGSSIDSITGDNNANVLSGNGGNDEIHGLGGNDTLIGGTGDDNLYGGSGDDVYSFSSGWGNDVVYEYAGEGTDTMDFSQVSDNLDISINTITVAYGSNSASHADNNVEIIQSGSGNDIFHVDASRSISLLGGGGNDRFIFNNGVTLTGMVDGQSGYDTLDMSGRTTQSHIVLTGLGSSDGFSGTETAINGSFTNIDQIVASTTDGGSLTGRNSNATFDLDGTNQYISEHLLDFTGFGELHGGSAADTFRITGDQTFELFGGVGNDTFSFADDAVLHGSIDGETGNNALDFGSYSTSRYVQLTGYGSSTGFTGREFSITGTFTNITHITGGSAVDTMDGTNDAGVWTITTTGGSYVANQRTMTFSSLETLSGSAADDRFIFMDGATLGGSIDGRGGTDTLDLSHYTTDLLATLTNGFVNVLVGGVTSIENIIGGSGNDRLYGDDGDNVLDGGAGNDYIYGLGGNDTLYTGSGNNTASGGDGDDGIITGNGTNILYGGNGIDYAIIWVGSIYSIPLNDIENIQWYRPPQPPDPITGMIPVTGEAGYYLIIPVVSGQKEELICSAGCIGIILQLPAFDQVYFGLAEGSEASLTILTEKDLPGKLPEGTKLVNAIRIDLSLGGQVLTLTGLIRRISFVIPAGYSYEDLGIWFWDATNKVWVEMPSFFRSALETGDFDRIEAFIHMAGIYILVVKE